MTRLPQRAYNGRAEVWFEGTQKMTANVQLDGYVEVSVGDPTIGGEAALVLGRSSWSGRLVSPSSPALVPRN